tara:strand:- start:7305 stop:7982 length:678 start_codon:yes stop_codon:yes gene_type:complete
MTNFKSFSIDKLKFNEKGLIPVIVQDWLDGTILMMAWMNKEALNKTLTTQRSHFWSRSRQALWLKGETSGNFQEVKNIKYDCDEDTLLLIVKQIGSGACHTGKISCFYRNLDEESILIKDESESGGDTCSKVFETIINRKNNSLPNSYTNSLLNAGINLILKKIGEESAEFIMACMGNNSNEISNEAADLIYHLQVALAYKNIDWKEVLEVLQQRRHKLKGQKSS